MMNGKDVIGHPGHVWAISLVEPGEFVGYRLRGPAAVGFAEYLMAAPTAMIRTSPGGDQRHRSRTVMFAPDGNVTVHVDRSARRPRLPSDIANLIPRPRVDNISLPRTEGDTGDTFQSVG